jgi:trans-2-enoyl-CoA reductase
VLVHWLACCVHDDDLVRVQSPLSVLNDYPPFNRTGNKWEAQQLPAVAGGEGVGVVVATARNVPHLASGALDVNEWVVALPEARLAPVGTWRTLCACDAARLLRVPKGLMPLEQLACARSLCTAYRLLEDYGGLKPGDTLIQNGAELPTGQAVVQLCALLKIRSINLVADDDGFEATQAMLKGMGASLVLRDNARLDDFLRAVGGEVPRLGLDALGGEHGKRMAMALRPEASLVVYGLQHGKLPSLSPSLLLYQQISLHGFNLAQWVSDEGAAAYLHMLEAIAELVKLEKLRVVTRAVLAAELSAPPGSAALREALGSHRATGTALAPRQRSVLVWADEAAAATLAFELRDALKAQQEAEAAADAEARLSGGGGTHPAAAAAAALRPRASERWADSTEMLKALKLEQYTEQFVEEEMTSLELLEEIVSRGDGERELMDALKEMGVKKMGHRQAIVSAMTQKS